MLFSVLTSFMLFTGIALGSEPSLGSCPDLRGSDYDWEIIKLITVLLIKGITNFTVTKYTGTWHEYSKLFLIPEAYGKLMKIFIEVYQEHFAGKCVRATYSDNGDGTVGVFNEQISSL